jgi:D-aminoacyl-tRNA deacylase
MRLVVQRVHSASVTVQDRVVAQIGPGLVALVGLHEDDTIADAVDCSRQLLHCKLWSNDQDRPWKQSVRQKQYQCLLVSQFTLYGTLSNKACQPDYKRAMKSEPARVLYEQFVALVRSQYGGVPTLVQDGVFGAMMDVALVNDGPVTILIDSRGTTSQTSASEGVPATSEEGTEFNPR